MTQQAPGAVVTIGDRQPDALALLIQQDIIYPGIDADTVYQNALLTHFLQPAADLAFGLSTSQQSKPSTFCRLLVKR